jgi:Abnormal spindle-like microcephaly-assoc'd, ASPM-SPD-2-Hydin
MEARRILITSKCRYGNHVAASVTQSLVIVDDTPTRIINVSAGLKFDELIIPETASKTFTITNSGNDKLTISAITFPEGYSGDKTSGSIAAGGSLVVTVTFAPAQAKEYTGVINITSNATSGLASLNVIGKGITITAIEDALGLKPMNVFPNPGRGIYTLNIKQPQSKQAVVIDELGRAAGLVDLQPSGEDLYQVDITSVRQGVYFIKLPADQKVKMVRIVKID